MLKHHVALCLLGTALIALPAFAQQQPPQQRPQPQVQQLQMQQQMERRPAQAGQVRYITENRSGLWRASKLSGVDVYNEQNEKIGDITEVLVDQQGRVEAVVIGVGGFLGIGQRDVAVPFESLRWQMDDRTPVVGTRTTTGAPPPGQRDTAAAPTERRGATTATPAQRDAEAPAPGATAAPPPAARDTRATNARGTEARDAPARAVLPGATKDQLKNAPQFKYGRS